MAALLLVSLSLIIALMLFMMYGITPPDDPILEPLWYIAMFILSVIFLLSMIFGILKATVTRTEHETTETDN